MFEAMAAAALTGLVNSGKHIFQTYFM